MRNLVIDIGNTFAKTAVFQDGEIVERFRLPHADIVRHTGELFFDRMIVSDVSKAVSQKLQAANFPMLLMSSELSFPFRIAYETPKTLGTDRLAGVSGAYALFPEKSVLCIDAGTCITYDFISNDGIYLGGSISPGLTMRFRALHEFTGKLPAVDFDFALPELIGRSTQNAILSGVVQGYLAEINGIIAQYKTLYGDMITAVCGGDGDFIGKNVRDVLYAPDLVLCGLNEILRYN